MLKTVLHGPSSLPPAFEILRKWHLRAHREADDLKGSMEDGSLEHSLIACANSE